MSSRFSCKSVLNDLEIKMEEAKEDTGRNDIKAEFCVISSALSKEMGRMKTQLNRWKDAALKAVALREKAIHSAKLSGKTSELKSLTIKCAEQVLEIKSSKALIRKVTGGESGVRICSGYVWPGGLLEKLAII